MPVVTATRPVLVASAVPGANEALATGQQARVAAWRAGHMRGEFARRLARPLPEGCRELRWALQNRVAYWRECQEAENDAADLATCWEFMMANLREDSPVTADAVDAAVWGTREKAADPAMVTCGKDRAKEKR